MSVALRVLGWIVLLAGITAAAVAAGFFAGDAQFPVIAAAYARHRDNPLFQAQYWAAAVQHYGLLAGAIAGAVGGVTLGAALLALGEILRRLS